MGRHSPGQPATSQPGHWYLVVYISYHGTVPAAPGMSALG